MNGFDLRHEVALAIKTTQGDALLDKITRIYRAAGWTPPRDYIPRQVGVNVAEISVDRLTNYPIGRCADRGCRYREPHRHGFDCSSACDCQGIGAETQPLSDSDLQECDWGNCGRPAAAQRHDTEVNGPSWLSVCAWHAGWEDFEEAR